MIPFKPSDFYHFRDLIIEDDILTSVSSMKMLLWKTYIYLFIYCTIQLEHDICLHDCAFNNRYMSDNRRSTHVRWCDTCELWFHEECAGQAIPMSAITPSDNQLYLTLDAQREKDMPSGVQALLRWPICRLSKEFTVESDTFWYPYSMEVAVKRARGWYSEGTVPNNWEVEVLPISDDNDFEFVWEELQAVLNAPEPPPYYLCPGCSSYI
jgi:hypothetical protein